MLDFFINVGIITIRKWINGLVERDLNFVNHKKVNEL